ncbi:MAG: hypothetical protein AAF685_06910 [Cyanobacteria bacterium P01_C01_bin.89]
MTNQKGDKKSKVTNLFSEQDIATNEGASDGEGEAAGLPIPLPKPPTARGAKLRRSTFQLRNSTVDDLDRFHLELQLALGKQNAPYKEVLVEAAIVYFLDSARANPSEWLDVLLEWQQMRRSR